MRDAFGGIVNIAMIVIFLVVVSGYLAFNVNYTKAFRVKNKIISAYEQYEGNCTKTSSQCRKQIQDYMKQVGYTTQKLKDSSYTGCDNGYCYQEIVVQDANKYEKRNKKVYYKIKTQINIDIPIINKILPGLRIFEVTGDTKVIEKVG